MSNAEQWLSVRASSSPCTNGSNAVGGALMQTQWADGQAVLLSDDGSAKLSAFDVA